MYCDLYCGGDALFSGRVLEELNEPSQLREFVELLVESVQVIVEKLIWIRRSR
jgi:hypothetical protein